MKFRPTFVLTLSFITLHTLSATAQDSSRPDLRRFYPIMLDISGKGCAIDGKQISYDSCKQLLLTFHSSAMELRKALRWDARQRRAAVVMKVLFFPTAGFVLADLIKSPEWLSIPAACLTVTFFAAFADQSISIKARRRHIKRSIDLYNAEMKKGG
jgi:hypothetical protein